MSTLSINTTPLVENIEKALKNGLNELLHSFITEMEEYKETQTYLMKAPCIQKQLQMASGFSWVEKINDENQVLTKENIVLKQKIQDLETQLEIMKQQLQKPIQKKEEKDEENITMKIKEIHISGPPSFESLFLIKQTVQEVQVLKEEDDFEEENLDDVLEDDQEEVEEESEEKEEQEEKVEENKVEESEEKEEQEEKVEESEEKEEQEEKVEEQEENKVEEEEFFEIEIDDKSFYVTDENNGFIYAIVVDGDVGEKVGVITDGEPTFY
jgi:cobalamin biosynthesis protein CobT